MSSFRALKIVFALAFGMAFPTLAALGYYGMTGDPTFRPLGISEAALAHFANSQKELAVVVTIQRGRDASLVTPPDEVERQIAAALRPYDVPLRIRTEAVAGRDVRVTLGVRGTSLGPYDVRQAASAIPSAVSVYRQHATREAADGWSLSFLK